MTINTTNFGELDVSPEQIIRVEAGLLGLEDHTEFVLVNNTDAGGKIPFWWLQSCKNPDTAFVVTIPFLFEKGYEADKGRAAGGAASRGAPLRSSRRCCLGFTAPAQWPNNWPRTRWHGFLNTRAARPTLRSHHRSS